MSAHGLATLCRVSEQADWLDDLPADASLRFERLMALLAQVNQKKINASARLACINAVLPLMTDLVAEKIENQFPMSLPLSPAHVQNVQLAETVYVALARAYEQALEPQKKAAGAMDLSPQENAAAHYGVLRCLAEILCLAFATYRKPTTGIWRNIHTVYKSALHQRLHLLELLEVPFTDATGTILQEYKRILLLGLSDPYELPFAAVSKLFGLLKNWSSLAHLHTEHCDDENFLIDPAIDAPALPMPHNSKPPAGTWLLDTRELIKAIEREANTLQRDARKHHDPEEKVFKTLQTIKILRRHWRGFSARQYPRQHVARAYKMLVGLRAIDFALNNFKESTEFVEATDNIVITTHGLHGSFGAQQWLSEHHFVEPYRCQSVDQNTEGMQLLVVPDPELSLHIGELLALRREGDWEEWRIGVLRWAKQNDDGKLLIGVYLIGYHAMACRIQLADPAQDNPQTENEAAAVLVQLSHPPGIGESLVAAPGIYSNRDKLWLRTHADLETRTMGKLLLTTRSFDWFEIKNTE